HGGYFSIDKKKVAGKTVEVIKDTKGDSKADDDTYNLIMRDKEKLLSFETPLKFIFSHSALREGWDNPNVFQICTLRDIQTERERRQTIGRGLRLCVNQEGQRLRGFDVNTLTVIATESYEQFAENLQKEIEADTGIRFGVVQGHEFAAMTIKDGDGKEVPAGFEKSKALSRFLETEGYINANGKVQDKLKSALKDGTLKVPAEFEAQRGQITEVLRKLSGKLEIKNADDRKPVHARQAVLHSPEFKELWNRIKHKTTYRVQFDNERLIENCIKALCDAPPIAKTRLQWRKADLSIGKGGIDTKEKAGADLVTLSEGDIDLPDLLTDMQDRTQLTRKTITRILIGSKRLGDFKRNPQRFIDLAADMINRCKRLALVDGIKYQSLGDEQFFAQELFEQEELTGYLKNMLMDTTKSIYEHVVYDSNIERDFADALEKNSAIKVYAKLPGWFKVPTPLGSYNPDWAVLVEQDGVERLYFVVETKSSLFTDDFRDKESAKIECAKVHFKTLAIGENPAKYLVARSIDDLLY
ncbi:MAG: restriction endonuclease subunit R, partial [Nitrosospira sp.]